MGQSDQRMGNEGVKKGKASHWKRRPRKTDQQEKMDHGQLNKRKKTSTSDLENLTQKKERQVGEALKELVKLN